MTTTEIEFFICIILTNIAIITSPIATYFIIKKQNKS